MCGIAGWVGGHDRSAVVGAMLDLIAHRGPDHSAVWSSPESRFTGGYARLSIQDLRPVANQPMIGSRREVLLYNGEIYNFRQLRGELEREGHRFQSSGDTEVVLKAYEQWGEQCVERFRGMFALAVWRPESESLFLARDPMGMKPLYYAEISDGRGIAFASELKALTHSGLVERKLDSVAVSEYLEFGYIWDRARTSIERVRKLPPGHVLVVGPDGPSLPRRYFDLPVSEKHPPGTFAEWTAQFGRLLEEVVDEHLIADVPVGLLLSGGIDSSALAAIASRRQKVQTFTFGFEESAVDERLPAAEVARFIGSEHHELLIRQGDFIDRLRESVWYIDDLFADWGIVTTRLLYERCAAEGLKVVIVGEGSDEVFGGYTNFAALPSNPRLQEIELAKLYRRLSGRRYGSGYIRFRSVFRRYLETARGNWFDALRLFEVERQLPSQYVMKVDKASMSVSVEARAPFLDQRVVEMAMRTPSEWLIHEGTEKFMLREYLRRSHLLPDSAVDRRKYGASIASDWIDQPGKFRDFASERLLRPDGVTHRLGYGRAMRSFFLDERRGYRFPHAISIFRNLAWKLLLLDLWAEVYLDS